MDLVRRSSAGAGGRDEFALEADHVHPVPIVQARPVLGGDDDPQDALPDEDVETRLRSAIANMGFVAGILATACGFAGTALGLSPAVGLALCGAVAGSIIYVANVGMHSSPFRCVRLAFAWVGQKVPSPAT